MIDSFMDIFNLNLNKSSHLLIIKIFVFCIYLPFCRKKRKQMMTVNSFVRPLVVSSYLGQICSCLSKYLSQQQLLLKAALRNGRIFFSFHYYYCEYINKQIMSVLHALIEIIFIFDLLIWFENSIRAIIIMAMMMMMMMTDRNWILFISLDQAFSVVKHEWNEMENENFEINL